MIMEEVKRIYKLLLDSTGLKIKDIAKALDLDKYYVADILFSSDNISYWYQDSSFLWFAKEGAMQIEEEPEKDNPFPSLDVQNVIFSKRFHVENASSTLSLYLKYVERYELYTYEETFELFKRSREGDEKAFKKLVTTHLRFVIPIAKLYTKYGLPLEDLIQEGNIGLMNAIKRFDYVHYRGFITYATSWIFQAISTYVQNHRYTIRIPINQLDLYRKVQKIKEKFEQKNGYRPSVSEIEIDNIPFERLALICKLPDNLNQLVCISEDLDSFESNLPPADDFQENEYNRYIVNILLRYLGKRDIQLVKVYFGLEHDSIGETYGQIGERFGLSGERVRQIVFKSAKIMRENVCPLPVVKQDSVFAEDGLESERRKTPMSNAAPIQEQLVSSSEENNTDIESGSKETDTLPVEKQESVFAAEKESPLKGNTIGEVIDEQLPFSVGDRIEHSIWGNGVVKEIVLGGSLIGVSFKGSTIEFVKPSAIKLRKEGGVASNGATKKGVEKRNRYEKSFSHYAERIVNLKQAKKNGEVIVAKPVLLLALIDGVDKDVFDNNHFYLNEWLEERYLSLMKEYTKGSQFPTPTSINNPFWHLTTDGFWHLQLKEEPKEKVTPTKTWLKDNVLYASFDDDLWILLQNREYRNKMRNVIIDLINSQKRK